MRLNKKVAVVYGAGCAVQSTVAQTFANEGAMIFLAGRNPTSVEAAAARIRLNGGVLNWRKASQESAYNKAARLMRSTEASGGDAHINPTVFSEGIANEGKLSLALLNRIRDHHINLLRLHGEERLRVRGI